MCFLLANASLNKISVLVTGACQSLVHFSFTHPFYVRTVYKRSPGLVTSRLMLLLLLLLLFIIFIIA